MLDFIRHNVRWLAGGFLLTYFSSFGQTFFISASIGEWQDAFGVSHGGFGLLYMTATLGSAICLPLVGRIVDVVPEHRVIAFTVPVLAAATLGAAFAPTLLLLGVTIFFLRLFGQGMMTHIAMTATGRGFAAQRGRAISLVVLGHQGGEATLPLAFSALSIAFGYRAGWITGAAALLLVALPLGICCYSRPRVPDRLEAASTGGRGEARRDSTRAEVLRDPLFWVLLTGVLAPGFIGTTIFFHQDHLTQLRGWPPQFYAQSLTVLAVTTVVFALICGAAIDRYGSRPVLAGFLLPLAAACFTLSIDGPDVLLIVVMTLLGIAYGMSTTLFGSMWAEFYGTSNLGALRSIVVSAMVLSTAAGPGATGLLIDVGIDLNRQMIGLAVYCLLASVGMIFCAIALRRRIRS